MKSILKPGVNALPPIFKGIPIIYEDDEHEEILMGENFGHYEAGGILYFCLQQFLERNRPDLVAACNPNCYYRNGPKAKKSGRKPYFSADLMIVQAIPDNPRPTSYTIGRDGPPPYFVCEILSQLSGKTRDPIEKPEIYAKLGVTEYVLLDELGRFLPQPLLLKRLRPDRTWDEILDDDGGITSDLGFRIVHDGRVRVLDAATGRPFIRPGEVEAEIELIEREKLTLERQKRAIERRNAEVEAENAALKEELAALRKKRNGGGRS